VTYTTLINFVGLARKRSFMRPFWGRFVRHAVLVGVSLAAIGYLLAQGFLIANRVYAGSAFNEENDRVLWQTPTVMAVLGILMCGGINLLGELFRKPAAVTVKVPSSPDIRA
jgi:ABC-type enterochelin transport system permease subunit